MLWDRSFPHIGGTNETLIEFCVSAFYCCVDKHPHNFPMTSAC